MRFEHIPATFSSTRRPSTTSWPRKKPRPPRPSAWPTSAACRNPRRNRCRNTERNQPL